MPLNACTISVLSIQRFFFTLAIIKDLTKNEYWQVYFKPLAVKEIIEWFNKNKEDTYYEIQYVRNTKNGKTGEIKERGYKIENICYKINTIS